MCTCELLVATMMNILILFKSIKNLTEYRNSKIRSIPSGGTHVQGTGGFNHTSRHRVLLEVANHSRCRTMFAVQSLERPLGEVDDPRKKKKTSAVTMKKTIRGS